MKTENSQSDEARFYKELEAEIAEWYNNINALYDKAYLEAAFAHLFFLAPGQEGQRFRDSGGGRVPGGMGH